MISINTSIPGQPEEHCQDETDGLALVEKTHIRAHRMRSNDALLVMPFSDASNQYSRILTMDGLN